MDDLLRNQSTKTNHESSLARKLDDETGIECDENQLYKGCLADNVEDQDQLYLESASINDILSPAQNPNDLSRYQNNIMTYISPSTKRLHDDIVANSPSRVRHHNAEYLRASGKNMISIIDYKLVLVRLRMIHSRP